MHGLALDYYGLFLVFLLGLRHGLDPDHIAIIDSISFRLTHQKSKLAPWVGTLFALGHGLVITTIAFAVGRQANYFQFSATSFDWLSWVPIALLVLIGTLNLRSLLNKKIYRPTGWRTHFMPKKLINSTSPWAILLVGVLFAMVFDTATQAAAWGYAASSSGSSWAALLMGLIFTAGMVITDTIDGRLLYLVSKKAGADDTVWQYRRNLGWIIVVSSFAVAAYKIGCHFFRFIELSDTCNLAIGLLLVLLVGFTYIKVFIRLSKIKTAHGH
jgi:nickel/cobalt transporter (NiCoT) family protein